MLDQNLLLSAVVDVGVLDPNMENVLDIPLRLFFIKFAVACDDDENNDAVPVDEVVDATPPTPPLAPIIPDVEMAACALSVVVVVVETIGLLTIGVVYCVV